MDFVRMVIIDVSLCPEFNQKLFVAFFIEK